MSIILSILLSVTTISLISLIGVLSLSIGRKQLHKFLILFVAFSSGSLLAASFLHLIPQAYQEIKDESFMWVLIGILIFFIFEKFVHWHHCGKEECHIKPVAYLNLVADGFHNFIDGIIIAAAYLVDIQLGIVSTIAIALHEIPQEFGDFSVLIHSGMKTKKALAYNFLSASTAILGALIGYQLLSYIESFIPYALSIAAGGFIYIAATDLMPELHKEEDLKKMITQTIALLLGVVVMFSAFSALPHQHDHGLNDHQDDGLNDHHEGTEHPDEGDIEHECLEHGGKWILGHNECEDINKSECDTLGGYYIACSSACRHDTEADFCTDQCVEVCKL